MTDKPIIRTPEEYVVDLKNSLDQEIKELRAENERLRERDGVWRTMNEGHQRREQELEAENERLRAAVDAARGIALRDSPTHQALRDALEALDRDKAQK